MSCNGEDEGRMHGGTSDGGETAGSAKHEGEGQRPGTASRTRTRSKAEDGLPRRGRGREQLGRYAGAEREGRINWGATPGPNVREERARGTRARIRNPGKITS